MFRKKNKAVISGILVFCFGFVYYLETFKIPIKNSKTWSSAAFPRIYSFAILVLGILILVKGIKEARTLGEDKAENGNDRDEYLINKKGLKYIAISFAVLILCIVLMEEVGFVICSSFYMMFHFIMLGKKSIKARIIYCISAVLIAVIIYLIFVNGFGLLLPSGKIL